MKAFLKKAWPSIAHTVAIIIVFADPSVQKLAAAHLTYSAAIALAWGYILHWAQSWKAKSNG